jgi:DNA-binding NarL/FixJ family response regulator
MGAMSNRPISEPAQCTPAAVDVLVAHENALLAAGVVSVLAPVMRGAVVPCTDLAQQAMAHRPGLLVTDYANGLRLLATLGRAHPPLLVLDERMAAIRVRLALDAGARGFVGAHCPVPVLLQAAQTLVHGQPYLCEDAAATLAEAAALTPLTPREQEVLALVCHGLNNKTIALHLDMAVGTVKTHVKAILGKLAVGSRTQAAAAARRLGLATQRPVLQGLAEPESAEEIRSCVRPDGMRARREVVREDPCDRGAPGRRLPP